LVTFYFLLPDSFRAIPRALCIVFKFCAPELIFDGTEGVSAVMMFCAPGLVLGGTEAVEAHFQVLRFRTLFWRNRGRRVPFSFFVLPDSFLTIPRPSGLDFMFCALGNFLDVTEGA
jgi:hypothetical protein